MCGTLNPHKSEKLTSASFAYDTGSSCMGGQESPSAGEFEGEGIQIYGNLSGLQPGTEYTYCLVAANISGETFGQPVSFTTTAAPKIEAATSVTSTSAILAGTLEPIDAVLHYKFLLSKGTACEGAFGTPPAAGENKVSAQVEGLTPNTEYTFCLLAIGHEGFAFNGEENWGVASGGPEHFTTKRSQAEIEAQEKLEQEAKAKSEAEAAAKKEQEEAAAAKRQEEEAAAARRREEAAKEAWTKKTEGASKPVLVFITKVEVRTAAVTITISASNNGAATVSGLGHDVPMSTFTRDGPAGHAEQPGCERSDAHATDHRSGGDSHNPSAGRCRWIHARRPPSARRLGSDAAAGARHAR
jgi:hypothetical protein